MHIIYRNDIECYQAIHWYPSVVGDGYRVMQYDGYGATHYQALMQCIASIAAWNGQEVRQEFGYDEHERPENCIAIVTNK